MIACPWARALSSSALRSQSQNTDAQRGRPELFSGQISMFSFSTVCLAEPATTLLLLFIVYLTSTFDYSLCRQKLVFVVLSPGQLPLATNYAQGHCRLPTGSEPRDRLPSPSATAQHTVGDKSATHTAMSSKEKEQRN